MGRHDTSDNVVRVYGEIVRGNNTLPVVSADGVKDYDKNKTQDVINAEVDAALSDKQDIISDLSTIRSGAAAGATALQNVKTINGESIVGTGNVDVVTDISGKADKATTLAGYGITDAYTKTETNTKLSGKANSADVYTKSQTYSKEEVNNLVTTPQQQYVTVTATEQTTDVTDLLPEEGESDTIYRVGNWDGTQYDNSVYSEYAWNGSTYIYLDTKTTTELDDEPTENSNRGVKSGGVAAVEGFYVDDSEWIRVILDAEGRILAGIKADGTTYMHDLYSETVDMDWVSERLEEAIREINEEVDEKLALFPDNFENIDDPEGRTEVTLDSDGRILGYRDSDGIKVENRMKINKSFNLGSEAMSDFQRALKESGFQGGAGDWSDDSYIHIPDLPTCALVNISGVESMPEAKGVDLHAYFEFWDKNGNYFKKKVILNGQGQSSMAMPKKNFACDFCEDDWEGDDTTSIKLGNWVNQDSFHFKAYYTSLTKGECPICYKIYDNMLSCEPFDKRAPYMEYYADGYSSNNSPSDDINQNFEMSAKCYPDGFPCEVYLNGEFYGIFAWQLKKHRDNFHMNKKNPNHIHLDGVLGGDTLFGGNISWKDFEIRNPKNLVYAEAHSGSYKYDADVVQDNIAGNNDGSVSYDTWVAGSYPVNKIVEHNGHKFINTIVDNEAEPIYHKKNNGDDAPDFKNKTGCGWINCTNTIKVKESIIALSRYMSEISIYETAYNNASVEDKPAALATLKEEIEKRFSMDWMIRYAILISFAQDGDSTRKNWQWTTWGNIDGKMKWYANPYDMDGAFGVDSTHSYSYQSPTAVTYGSGSTTPIYWCWNYYMQDLKQKYALYRTSGVLNYSSVFNLFKDWCGSIGLDAYNNEIEKWNETPACRPADMSDSWEATGRTQIYYWDSVGYDWNASSTYNADAFVRRNFRLYKSLQPNNTGNIPEESPLYWEDVTVKAGTYNAGDTVYDGYSSFREFRVKTGNTVIVTEDLANDNRPDHLIGTPIGRIYETYPHEGGVFESIYRISKWVAEKISVMDIQMGYNV